MVVSTVICESALNDMSALAISHHYSCPSYSSLCLLVDVIYKGYALVEQWTLTLNISDEIMVACGINMLNGSEARYNISRRL
jgi:hypothetical protein